LTALVLNRGISPVGAFAGGAAVVALIRIRQRRQLFVTVASAVAIAMIAIAAYAPMRERFVQISRWKAAGDWNAVTSYRLVPWAAASEMFLARPLLGWGPGTFATEFVPHLVRAEVRWRTRLVHPFLVGSYAEAHSDYLQSLAEMGAAAVLFALIAAGITMYSCARSLAKPDARAELSLPISIAVAGAIAALTWLPLQQPATALLLLAAFGRAWRISLDSGTPIP
jgi:O-antigen ligase